jgi:hypothetical protein
MVPQPNPKPRFYALRFYALICGQAIGFLIVILGMIPYWFGAGRAKVPNTISWRVAGICLVLLLSIIVPMKNSAEAILYELAGSKAVAPASLADNPVVVRKLLWAYLYLDLILLTYLVHITGGITGSMYGGIYLMLPSVSLLLRLHQEDILRAKWLALACSFGIFLSFFMSRYHFFEFNAASFGHAFDISLSLVTLSSIILTLIEIAILKRAGMGETLGNESGG